MKTFLALCLAASATAFTRYEATVDQPGVQGRFGMRLTNSSMYFGWDLSFDAFPPELCNLTTDGLTVHIHSKWAAEDKTEGSTADCGPQFTAGHWDPTLMCGPSSSQLSRPDGTANPACANYKEGMSPAALAASYRCSTFEPDQCELGDITGRHGRIMLAGSSSAKAAFTVPLPLPLEELEAQYGATLVPGSDFAWASVVAHCAPTNARLFCAQLEPRSSAPANRRR